MLKLEKCKKILQAGGKKYSDDQVKKIREELYNMATIVDDTKTIRDAKVNKKS